MSDCCDHDHEKKHAPADADHYTSDAHAPAGSLGAVPDLAASEAVADGIRSTIRIMQMDCPTEEALIRNKLAGMRSVTRMDFNLMQRVLTVVHAPGALETIMDALRALGFQPEVAGPGGQPAAVAREKPGGRWRWPGWPRSHRKRRAGAGCRTGSRRRWRWRP